MACSALLDFVIVCATWLDQFRVLSNRTPSTFIVFCDLILTLFSVNSIGGGGGRFMVKYT